MSQLFALLLLSSCQPQEQKTEAPLRAAHAQASRLSEEFAKEPLSPLPPLKAHAESIASYRIEAKLDELQHSITGKLQLRFVNRSERAVSELFFHLYLNAFENKNTLFRRTEGGRSGDFSGKPGKTTVFELTSPRFPGINLWENAAKHSPNDKFDRTDIRVPLPAGLPSNEELQLNLSFRSDLPEIVERTGYRDTFHFAGQWFPKLAKHNRDGSWAHFAFHPYAEFYADFGNYEVQLDLPQAYVVGASGELISEKTLENGRKSLHFRARDVHDFAFSAWPEFEESNSRVGDVRLRILAPADSALVRKQIEDTVRHGLKFLGSRYGEYPHKDLTVVHPPSFASRAGGMEYPQLITTTGSEALAHSGVRMVELVTIHELAHQWFQGLLASNETQSPFLDEGLTSYAEWSYLKERFGEASILDWPGLSISRESIGRFAHLQSKRDQKINTAAADFKSFSRIGSLVYGRTPLALLTLAGAYGQSRLDRALSIYARRYRFGHPGAQDFYNELTRELGKDAGNQAFRMFEEQGWIDLSIQLENSEQQGATWHSQLKIKHAGDLELPYTVLLLFQDGTEKWLEGVSVGKEKLYEISHTSPLKQAIVDPQHRLMLDENFFNNRVLAPQLKPEQAGLRVRAVNFFSLLLLGLSG